MMSDKSSVVKVKSVEVKPVESETVIAEDIPVSKIASKIVASKIIVPYERTIERSIKSSIHLCICFWRHIRKRDCTGKQGDSCYCKSFCYKAFHFFSPPSQF